MSTHPPISRHPLGLPPGSIRALLILMITGLFATMILLPTPAEGRVEVPMFLYPLLSLMLVFVTSHGTTIGTEGSSHPLHLPKGTLRFVIAGGIIAASSWKYANDRAELLQRLTPTEAQLWQWPQLLAALFGGFLAGRLLRMGPWRHTAMYKDMLAWVSLLCMIGLAIESLTVVFIRPNLPEGVNMKMLEVFLTTAVALYFGARS